MLKASLRLWEPRITEDKGLSLKKQVLAEIVLIKRLLAEEIQFLSQFDPVIVPALPLL